MESRQLGNWACMDCGARQHGPGACSACGDEPVLDLSKPATVEMLSEDDVHRRSKRQDRLRYAVVPIAIVLTVLMAVYVPGVNQLLLSLPFFMGYPVGMALVAFGMILLYNRLFPFEPRFPYASIDSRLP